MVPGMTFTHPRSMAARQTEWTVASDTEHSPSERKISTGALYYVNHDQEQRPTGVAYLSLLQC